MEFNGINFLLILLVPVGAIILIMILISPLYKKAFPKLQSVESQYQKMVKEKKEELIAQVKQEGITDPGEIIDRVDELLDLYIDGKFKALKTYHEEGGFNDVKQVLNTDIKDYFK